MVQRLAVHSRPAELGQRPQHLRLALAADSESLLTGAAIVFLLPAILVAAHALSLHAKRDPFDWFYWPHGHHRGACRRLPAPRSSSSCCCAARRSSTTNGRTCFKRTCSRAASSACRRRRARSLSADPARADVDEPVHRARRSSSRRPPRSAPSTCGAAPDGRRVHGSGARLVRTAFGARHAALAAVLAACSPFVWWIYAPRSHSRPRRRASRSSCGRWFVRLGRAAWMLVAGLAIGVAEFITRPFEALRLATPAALRMLWEARRAPLRPVLALAGFAAVAWTFLLSAPTRPAGSDAFEMPQLTGAAEFPSRLHARDVVRPARALPAQAIGDLVGAGRAHGSMAARRFPGSLVFAIAGALRARPTRNDKLLRATLLCFVAF